MAYEDVVRALSIVAVPAASQSIDTLFEIIDPRLDPEISRKFREGENLTDREMREVAMSVNIFGGVKPKLPKAAAKAVPAAGKSVTPSGLLERPTIKGATSASARINQEIALKEIAEGKLPATAAERAMAQAIINRSPWLTRMPKAVAAALGLTVFGIAWYAFEGRGEAGIAASLPKQTEEDLRFALIRTREDLKKGFISREQAAANVREISGKLPEFERSGILEAVSGAGTATAERRTAIRKEISELQQDIMNIVETKSPTQEQITSEGFRQRALVQESEQTDIQNLTGKPLEAASRLITERERAPIQEFTPEAGKQADITRASLTALQQQRNIDDRILQEFGTADPATLDPNLALRIEEIKKRRGIV